MCTRRTSQELHVESHGVEPNKQDEVLLHVMVAKTICDNSKLLKPLFEWRIWEPRTRACCNKIDHFIVADLLIRSLHT